MVWLVQGEKCILDVHCTEQPLSPFSASVPKNHPLSRSSAIYKSPNWNFCSPVAQVLKVPKDSSLHATSLLLSRNLLLTAEGNIVSFTFIPSRLDATLCGNTGVWWICFMVMSTAHQKQEYPSSLGNDQIFFSLLSWDFTQ